MTTIQIKQLLHNYIDDAEDKKIKALHTLLENEIVGEYILSKAQKEELDKRYEDYQNGINITNDHVSRDALAKKYGLSK